MSRHNRDRRSVRVDFRPSKPDPDRIMIDLVSDPISRSEAGKDRRHYVEHNTQQFVKLRRELIEAGQADYVIISGDMREKPIRWLSDHTTDPATTRYLTDTFTAGGTRPSFHVGVPRDLARKWLDLARVKSMALEEPIPEGCFAVIVFVSGGMISVILSDED